MDDKRFDRFIKLMMLSTSSMDGEALAALRRANLILAEENKSWEELLRNGIKLSREQPKREKTQQREETAGEQYRRGREGFEETRRRHRYGSYHTPKPPRKEQREYDDQADINPMFDYLFQVLHIGDSFLDFVKSVYSYFKVNGYLTYGQYDAIYRAFMSRR